MKSHKKIQFNLFLKRMRDGNGDERTHPLLFIRKHLSRLKLIYQKDIFHVVIIKSTMYSVFIKEGMNSSLFSGKYVAGCEENYFSKC